MNPPTLQDHWKHHLDAWSTSGSSQNAYCQAHGLRPNQFTYWKRKLIQPNSDHPTKPYTDSPAFVPLAINHRASSNSLCLRLPNGCELSGIEAQHLPIVTQLLEVLV